MEFTRVKLKLIAGGWMSDIGPVGVQSLAKFAAEQLDRAEKVEGWALHWKGEAERLERELYLARLQHANREAPAEQNPELAGLRENAERMIREGVPSAAEKPISEVETKFYRDGERVPLAPVTDDDHGEGDPSFLRERVALLEEDVSKLVRQISDDASGVLEAIDSGPQRPHESLVWAIYHSVYVQKCSEGAARDIANDCVERWRRRWPEESE